MKLEVIIGKKESEKGRVFENIKEAAFYMTYHAKYNEGIMIDKKPKYDNEIKRMVFKDAKGEKHYYILKITN